MRRGKTRTLAVMQTTAATQATVRSATAGDAKASCDLHIATVRALCAPFYDPAVIDGWLRGRTPEGYLRGIKAGLIFVAECRGAVVGWGDAHPGEVDALFVDPRHSRRGIGSLLLAQALEKATTAEGLIKVDSTLNAVPFYERFGFKLVRHAVQRRNDVDVPVATMERNAG
jgi:GNAT superfamily N-acetyltransferase